VPEEDLSQTLRDVIRDALNMPEDDERDWLRDATKIERRVIGDFGDLERDLRGPSEGGTALERTGLRAGTPKVRKVEPENAETGSTVTLYGDNLFGVAQVLFGDIPAEQMVVVSNQRIEVVVPDDADSGQISIVTRPSRKQRQRQRAEAREASEDVYDEQEIYDEEEEPEERTVVASRADDEREHDR
jgi:hypothetical protein